MTRLLGCGITLVGLMLFLPAEVQSQAKKGVKNGNVTQATAEDYKNLERLKEIVATMVSADSKSVTVRVEAPQLKIAGSRRPVLQTVRAYKEYNFDLTDTVVVRKRFVAPDYDDKGNFKLNEEQAKELRKNGFIASKIEDIQSGNIATLYFAPTKKSSGKKDDDIDANRRSVNKIVLIGEGIGPVAGSNSTPPKKKKDT
jgi:hypothetical protein